jgi:light-independent protochlorophyllide reductase subunit B
MMGLEEHLLAMFRDDFEFHDDAAPSHLGGTVTRQADATQPAAPEVQQPSAVAVLETTTTAAWAPEAEKELSKIPFFVRGKARRNTERFALEHGVTSITIETLYDAKAHFSR